MNYSQGKGYHNQRNNYGPSRYQGNPNRNNSFENNDGNNRFPPNQRNSSTRDVRTTESQIVCNFCGKAGHHGFACFARNRLSNRQQYPVQKTSNPNDEFQRTTNSENSRNNSVSHEGWASFTNESSNPPTFNKMNTISIMNTKNDLGLVIEILSPIIKDAEVLCDSGAAVSVINSKVFPQLRKFLNNKNKGDSIISVTGQEEPIEGTVNIELRIPDSDGTTYEYEFNYANIGNETIILGRDFLEAFKAIINIGEKTIQFTKDDHHHVLSLEQCNRVTRGNYPCLKKLKKSNIDFCHKKCFSFKEPVRIKAYSTDILSPQSPWPGAKKDVSSNYLKGLSLSVYLTFAL